MRNDEETNGTLDNNKEHQGSVLHVNLKERGRVQQASDANNNLPERTTTTPRTSQHLRKNIIQSLFGHSIIDSVSPIVQTQAASLYNIT